MNPETIQKITTLVQSRIDQFHTTKPWSYTSTTPQGVDVSRIGIGVYLDNDKQIELISNALHTLSEETKAGAKANPILVDVDGTAFVVVAGKLSTDDANLSKRPKLILADHMLGSNAEVDADTRRSSLRLLQEMRESNKNLKSEVAKKKELVSVSDKDFDDVLLS